MKEKLKLVEKQERDDGWSNLITMLGTSADKRTGARINWENRPPEFYEQLYSGGGIPARIVDLIPDEAMRRWLDWTGVEHDEKEVLEDRCQQLDVRGAILKTWKWARAYGGACLHIVTDTRDPSSPLKAGEKVIGLRDLSRWDLRILTTDIEYDFGSPNWGMPRIYYLNVQMGSQYKGYPIHWTRMIRFDGQLVPRRTYIRNNYWHDSILNRLYDVIRDYQISNDAAAATLQDFNVDVFKMKNLAQLIGAGKEQLVKNRLEILNFSKSVINAMLIDSDEEDYENKGRSMEGVADLLVHQANRLVAETDIPHTKLLGESPDGSNATGNSTSQQWYNFIGSEQENYLKPKLTRLRQILWPDRPTLGFKFRALRQLDDLEQAELRYKTAQTDEIYITGQVLDPTEVAESRFGGEEYSTDTTLDEEGRAAGLINPGAQDLGDPNAQPGDPVDAAVDVANKHLSDQDPVQAAVQVAEKHDPIKQAVKVAEKHTGGQLEKSDPIQAAVATAKKHTGEGEDGEGEGSPGASETNPASGDAAIEAAKAVANRNTQESAGDGSQSAGQEGQEVNPGPGLSEPERNGTGVEGGGVGELFSGMAKSGTEFDPRNEDVTPKDALPKEGTWISQTMSEPMRDPRTDPQMKGPGIPNKPRLIEPTIGNGIIAPLPATVDPERQDAEEKPNRAATIIVRRGDAFLMGKRRDTGRWTLPGGVVEKRESLHQGGVRELAEETGIVAKRLKFLGSRLTEPEQGQSVTVSIYGHDADDKVRPTAKNDPDREITEWRWIPVKGPLPEEIAGNLQHPNNVALQHMKLLK